MQELIVTAYVYYLGVFLAVIGLLELMLSSRAFRFWLVWINNPAFPLHGLLLVAGGMPLTMYGGPLSAFVFTMGLFAVFTGPFVLLYPDKIRVAFRQASIEEGEEFQRRLVRIDGFLRCVCGGILILTRILAS